MNKVFMMILLMLSQYVYSQVDSGVVNDISTAFNYQGEVIVNGSPANGVYDVEFQLYESLTGGFIQELDFQTLEIVNGRLNALLDFGSDVFTGERYWLGIIIYDIETGNGIVMQPRIPIHAVPYAMMADRVSMDSINSNSITNLSIINNDIANNTLRFEKFSTIGAINGDVIQFNGSGWEAASLPDNSSPWFNVGGNISYSAGNVGVGTGAPFAKFHLHGNTDDELRISGTNGAPALHFRRNSNGADWYLRIDPSTNNFNFQNEENSVEKTLTIKPNGEITRKKQTKTTYVSYESFVPESHVYEYSTLSFFGFKGLHSLFNGGGPAKFHANVSLPVGAVITQVEMLAADNSTTGAVTVVLGYRTFLDAASGSFVVSTLTSNDSPFVEITNNVINQDVGGDHNYFLNVDIDNVTTAGQEVMFGGVRITYETTVL